MTSNLVKGKGKIHEAVSFNGMIGPACFITEMTTPEANPYKTTNAPATCKKCMSPAVIRSLTGIDVQTSKVIGTEAKAVETARREAEKTEAPADIKTTGPVKIYRVKS